MYFSLQVAIVGQSNRRQLVSVPVECRQVVADYNISVAVIDANDIFRRGCSALFQEDERFSLVVSARSLSHLEHVASASIDVLVLDPNVMACFEISNVVRARGVLPAAGIIVLTDAEVDRDCAWEILNLGVKGLIAKSNPEPEILLSSVVLAANGAGVTIDDLVLGRIRSSDEARSRLRFTATRLTEREREVLKLLAEGLTDDEAARTLRIAATTVHTHISNILHKLPVTNRFQLGAYALANDLIPDWDERLLKHGLRKMDYTMTENHREVPTGLRLLGEHVHLS